MITTRLMISVIIYTIIGMTLQKYDIITQPAYWSLYGALSASAIILYTTKKKL